MCQGLCEFVSVCVRVKLWREVEVLGKVWLCKSITRYLLSLLAATFQSIEPGDFLSVYLVHARSDYPCIHITAITIDTLLDLTPGRFAR